MNISIALAWHFLKHAIDHTDVEVHMPVQAGAESVDKGQRANVQRRPVHLRRTGAVGLQPLRNLAQENAQHHVEHGSHPGRKCATCGRSAPTHFTVS
jgi:hypothetical protein